MPGGAVVIDPCRGSANRPGRQLGVGLIEILVAVLLLSIGFLAVARMQVQGMRISQDAYHRSQAYFMATDMIDRMRSNVPGLIDKRYDGMSTAEGLADPGCASKSCSAAQLAAQDRFDWSAHLHPPAGEGNRVAALPSSEDVTARGEVTAVAGQPGLYRIRLSWSETIGGSDQERFLDMNVAMEIPQ